MNKILRLFFNKNQAPLVSRRNNIAIFVDGPNILRKEFNIDLSKITRYLKDRKSVV